MAERIITPTEGIEAFVNKGGSITLKQNDANDELNFVVIELRDVETVRQWLAELLVEALEDEGNEA